MKLFKYELSNRALKAMVAVFSVNMLVFYGSKIVQNIFQLEFHDMTSVIDLAIPFSPVFVLFYVGWFPFVLVNFYLATKDSTYHAVHFATAHILGELTIGVLFIIYPTTYVRPEITTSDFCSFLVKMIYDLDPPVNLFPSIHCYGATMATLAILRSKKLPWGYKVFTCLFYVGICASTVLIKQHVFADVLSGIFIAVFYWFVTRRFCKRFTDNYAVLKHS